jgi:HAD superfamily hydrolase (TIGR01509 family)
MTVRVVFFDVGGVLSSEDEMPEPLVAAFTLSDAPDGIDDLIATGHHREEDFHATLVAGGATDEQADDLMAQMWEWYCGTPDHALLQWAATLRNRVTVGIISNSADGARREEETRYAFSTTFDHIVYSHEVGLAKPDHRIFALACDRVGVAPNEAVFIDDRQVNVEAACEFGMQGVLHRSAEQTIAIVEPWLPPRVQP